MSPSSRNTARFWIGAFGRVSLNQPSRTELARRATRTFGNSLRPPRAISKTPLTTGGACRRDPQDMSPGPGAAIPRRNRQATPSVWCPPHSEDGAHENTCTAPPYTGLDQVTWNAVSASAASNQDRMLSRRSMLRNVCARDGEPEPRSRETLLLGGFERRVRRIPRRRGTARRLAYDSGQE